MSQVEEQPATSSRSRWMQGLGWCMLAVPLLALLAITVRTSVNIPLEDDYGAVGEFLEHYVALTSLHARIGWILTAQFVQYKLIFLHAVVALQYECIGHSNYAALQYLGDLALPGTVLVLWFLLGRSGRPLTQRVWLFALPCYVYLSLCYVQTVNWAMSGLQNLMVIPFAMASIVLFTGARRGSRIWDSRIWGFVFLVLAIATSGNGFFAALVIFFLLLWDRRFREAGLVVAITLALALLYAYHYQVYSVDPPLGHFATVKSLILFPLAFLGAAAGGAKKSPLLGLLLLVGFIVLARRGWHRVCPGSFGAALFCLITAAGVDITRYRGGFLGALAERYRMYCLLLIALEYLAVLRLYVPPSFGARFGTRFDTRLGRRWPWPLALALATAASVLFCVRSDIAAYRVLHLRKEILITHLILWERHPDRLVVLPDEDSSKQLPVWIRHRREAQRDIQREIAMGLYNPPYAASDPLPVRPHSPATIGIEDEGP